MAVLTKEMENDLDSKGDTYIYEANPFTSVGLATSVLYVGADAAGLEYYTAFELKLPPEPTNAGRITQVRLGLYITAKTGAGINSETFILQECNDELQPGFSAAPGATLQGQGANWYTRDGVHAWTGVTGTPGAPVGQPSQDFSTFGITPGAIGTALCQNFTPGATAAPYRLWIDITDYVQSKGMTWDSTQDVWLVPYGTPAVSHYLTIQATGAGTNQMEIEVTYDVADTNLSPAKEEKFLEVEALESDREQAKLTWPVPKEFDLRNDTSGSYLLVRHTSSIQNYATGTLLARLTKNEYIDDLSGASHDGNSYYYRLLVCDGDNYVSGTGTGAMSVLTVVGTPQWTNEVTVEKPNVITFVESGADYSWDVWETHTTTATSVSPSALGAVIEAYQYDWWGDGSEVGWVELETPSNSHSQDYAYTEKGAGAVIPKARVRNSQGFISSPQSMLQITLTAIDAIAEVKASPMDVATGDVLRLRADDSYDQNGDGTITKYEFQVQRASDSEYWDGSTGWQVAAYWKDTTSTPYVDVPAAAIDHTSAETYTCKSRVTGLSTSAVTSSGVDVTGSVSTAIDIRDTLSSDTKISAYNGNQAIEMTRSVPVEGTGAIRIIEGVDSQISRLEGVCHREDNWHTDMIQLFTWAQNQTLLKYFYEEPGTSYFMTFKIDRVEKRRRETFWYEWAIDITVVSMTV